MAASPPAQATMVSQVTLVRPSAADQPKVVSIAKATDASVQADPLLRKLKEWDRDGDGNFSMEEVMQAASELLATQQAEKNAKELARRLSWVTIVVGFLLLLSIAGTFVCTLLALQMVKESKVPQGTGVMLTNPSSDAEVQPVATSSVREVREGVSGLKMATKEELDRLKEVHFFHDSAYHRLRVSQIHRFDGRVEVWGCPSGILIVEDTGEVHFTRFGLPGNLTDGCWGLNATINSSDICGEGVDNQPPLRLEVENPVLQSAENAPTPSPEGGTAPPSSGRRLVAIGTDGQGTEVFQHVEEADSEHAEHARQLSSRRRSAGSMRRRAPPPPPPPPDSRRRAPSPPVVESPRRRTYGGLVSDSSNNVNGDARRRTIFTPTPSPPPPSPSPIIVSPSPSPIIVSPSPSPIIVVPSPSPVIINGVDGTSRRREVDLYDSRRRAFVDYNQDITIIDRTTQVEVNTRPGPPPITCGSGYTVVCNNGNCECNKTSTVLGWVIGIGVTIAVLIIIGAVVLMLKWKSG